MQLGEGAGRHPGLVRRGRLARAACPGHLAFQPRDRRPEARRGAHDGGALRDSLAGGARRRVHEGERQLPASPLRRRVPQAPAPGRRPHGPGDHGGAARRGRVRRRDAFPKSPLAELARGGHGWRARAGEHVIDAATVILAAGGRCFAEARERGELTTNHPGATGEVTRIALDAAQRRATSTRSSTTRTAAPGPETLQGYSIPETTRAYGGSF